MRDVQRMINAGNQDTNANLLRFYHKGKYGKVLDMIEQTTSQIPDELASELFQYAIRDIANSGIGPGDINRATLLKAIRSRITGDNIDQSLAVISGSECPMYLIMDLLCKPGNQPCASAIGISNALQIAADNKRWTKADYLYNLSTDTAVEESRRPSRASLVHAFT